MSQANKINSRGGVTNGFSKLPLKEGLGKNLKRLLNGQKADLEGMNLAKH